MTDATWGDESAPPKKSGLPKWVFFCAGGCLLAIIAIAVAGKLLFDQVKTFGDAEQQLPALQAVLPFDPLPEELEFQLAIPIPFRWYVFTDKRGFVVFFMVASEGQAEELRQAMLDPNFDGMGLGQRSNAQGATVEVQGRELNGLRFQQQRGSGQGGVEAEGQSIVLEVGPEGGSKVVIVQITRGGSSEPITDDEVRTLLEPFHVGTDR